MYSYLQKHTGTSLILLILQLLLKEQEEEDRKYAEKLDHSSLTVRHKSQSIVKSV